MEQDGHPTGVQLPAEPSADPTIGRLFGGRYKALSKLGEGAFGAVYKGVQVNLAQPVAIKVLKAELSENDVTVQRFYNEARIYAQIGHPHVVKIHDFGQDPGDPTLYLVMEFLEGKDLEHLLKDDGPLPADRLMLLATQILQGLDASHRLGIIHRDLKPANVLVLEPDSERPFAKLVDFGISKLAEGAEEEHLPDDPLAVKFQQGLTRAGKFTGTPAYMSPEQCYGHPLDARSDLYSMGVLLYELACGRVPFTAKSLFALLHKHASETPPPMREYYPELKLPKKLESLIMRCLEKSPEARYQSAEEILQAIEAVQRDEVGPEVMSLIEMDETASQEASLPVSKRSFGDEDIEEYTTVVRQILRALARAYKGYALYPKDNPVFAQLSGQLLELLNEYFKDEDELELSIDRFAIFFGGNKVYEDPDLRNSYPFKLFSDGIRRLYVRDGVTADQISAYFDCLRQVSQGDSLTKDLVTLMWEKRLSHISYLLVDDLIEDSMPDIDLLAAGFNVKEDRAYRGDEEKKKGKRKKKAIEEGFLDPFTPEERQQLRLLVQEFSEADHATEFIRCLFHGLLRVENKTDAEFVIQMLGELCTTLSMAGNMRHVTLMLKGIRAMSGKIDDLEIREKLLAICAIPGTPDRLNEIVGHLRETDEAVYWEMISELVKLLHPAAVENLLILLGTLSEERELPLFQNAIQHLCRDNPERLQVGLQSKDETVVVATLPILEKLGGPDARRMLTSSLTHAMPTVRKQALLCLTRLKAPDLGEQIIQMISDSNGGVRTAAIGACLSIEAGSAQSAIAQTLADEDFPERRREEQVKVLQVAARIKGDPVVEALSRYLEPLPLPWYKSQEGTMAMAAVVATVALVVLMWQLSIPVALGLWLVLGVGAWIGGMELVVAENEEATTLVEPVAKTLARIGTKTALRSLHNAGKNGPREVQGICRRILKMRKELRAEQADLETPDSENDKGDHTPQGALA